MATTVLSLLTSAVNRSTLNDPEVLVIEPEIVRIVQGRLEELYVLAGARAPMFFGRTFAVAAPADGTYVVPSDCLRTVRVSDAATGEKIPVVDIEALELEIAPRLFRVGRALHMPSQDAVDGYPAITGYYAPSAPELNPGAALDATANTLPDEWREEHNELLVDDIAHHLATRDGRSTAELDASLEKRLALFAAHVDALAAEDVDGRG